MYKFGLMAVSKTGVKNGPQTMLTKFLKAPPDGLEAFRLEPEGSVEKRGEN